MKNIPLLSSKHIFHLIVCFSIIVGIDSQLFAQSYKIKTIVIDAGHGGKDGSTRGIFSKEKDVTLKTALNLGKLINEKMPEVKVVYTRENDTFVPLYERIGLANKVSADLFISIHCNDMPSYPKRVITRYKKGKKGKKTPIYSTIYLKNTSTQGTETFVSGSGRINEQDVAIIRENSAMFLEENYQENYQGFNRDDPESAIILSYMKNAYRTQSLKLAKLVQEEYVKVGRINRGVQEKSLAVLARAGMPAILTEIGFISNPQEEIYINSPEGQAEITNCLLNAIKAYKQSLEI